MEEYFLLKSSIQALSLAGAINLAGFICSLENIRQVTMNYDESMYNWTILDKLMGFASKPGRNLAYLISKK